MKYSGMKTTKYKPGSLRFPTSVYPQIAGIPVQFIMQAGTDFGALMCPAGEVCNVGYVNSELAKVAEAIMTEDQTPGFEMKDWASGVVIEGVLSTVKADTQEEILDDLIGDFGDVAGASFVGLVAIPYRLWRAGRDRYDVGMRRATLMRAMGKLGMLSALTKSCCWLLPMYSARNEFQMMSICEKLSVEKIPRIEMPLSFKPLPALPVKNGMAYDFMLPWTAGQEFMQTPTPSQIEDGLL